MTKNKMPVKEFLPLLGVTAAAFIFNTSEFMPIGLLTGIAADFNMTEAAAGRLISVYAWVVMILSLPLMLLVCRMELKKLMLTTIGVFSASQLLSAVSTGFWGLMAARVGVASRMPFSGPSRRRWRCVWSPKNSAPKRWE